MPEELNNYDIPVELAFDITKTSGQMKFLGLSQRPEKADNELAGLFDWTCQACGATNRDSVVLKPQQVFFAKWTCSHCARVTLVRFRARAVAEWISQHTVAVTGKPMNSPPEDKHAGAPVVCWVKQPDRGRREVLLWIAVLALALVIVLQVLNVWRLSNSSAAPVSSTTSEQSGAKQGQSPSSPSARIVGYWVSAARDHVVYFGPIDPALREGTYTVARRGDKQADTVRFKVVHEEAAGEEIVIRREQVGRDKLVVHQKGSEITYRVQAEAAEVTLNVAKDSKSMTRVEIRDGEPVMTVYSNAGEAANP